MGNINELLQNRPDGLKIIEEWAESYDIFMSEPAMKASIGRQDVPVHLLNKGLVNPRNYVPTAAVEACRGRDDIPIHTLEEWMCSDKRRYRQAAMFACIGRKDVPLWLIKQGLGDNHFAVHAAAVEIGKHCGIPITELTAWLHSSNDFVRDGALIICRYYHLTSRSNSPTPWLELTRTFEVPELVYARTLTGLVTARIPDDAIVIGSLTGECRSNKAIIVEVDSPLGFGLSYYDGQTTYQPGEEVVIDDFDTSDERYFTKARMEKVFSGGKYFASGFHFSCSK